MLHYLLFGVFFIVVRKSKFRCPDHIVCNSPRYRVLTIVHIQVLVCQPVIHPFAQNTKFQRKVHLRKNNDFTSHTVKKLLSLASLSFVPGICCLNLSYLWLIDFNYFSNIKRYFNPQFLFSKWVSWNIFFDVTVVVNVNLFALILITIILTIHFCVTALFYKDTLSIPTCELKLWITLKNKSKNADDFDFLEILLLETLIKSCTHVCEDPSCM